jgi:acylphosphatase
MQNIHIEIIGQVHKTGYRYFVKQMADLNNIVGYVSYVNENTVCIEAHGEEQDMEKFLSFCKMGNLGTEICSFLFYNVTSNEYQTFEIR